MRFFQGGAMAGVIVDATCGIRRHDSCSQRRTFAAADVRRTKLPAARRATRPSRFGTKVLTCETDPSFVVF